MKATKHTERIIHCTDKQYQTRDNRNLVQRVAGSLFWDNSSEYASPAYRAIWSVLREKAQKRRQKNK